MGVAPVAREDLGEAVTGGRGGVHERVRHRTGLVVQAVPRQPQRDEGVVVGPDRTPVIRQRMVGGLAGGECAHAPAGEEVRFEEPAAHQLAVLLVQQARPQQMTRVRGERVDMAAVAVQRQRGEGVFTHPEVPLEPVAEVGGGLFQERRVDLVAPDRAGQQRGAAQRVVRVSLGARRHHRPGRAAAVGRTDGAGGVLPVLVGEAAAVRAVDEIAARGQPAVVQHPADRRTGVGLQPAGQRHITGPLGVRAEEHQEQRRRVHRTVVAPVRHLPEVRQLAVPHLVHDLAGLGDRVRAHLDRLGGGQRGQRGGGELGPVGQREERGEQRVTAQQGEEPGDSGRGNPQLLAVRARRRHLEDRQVRQAPRTGRGQLRPAGREGHALRELALQGEESLIGRGGGGGHPRRVRGAVRTGRDPERQLRRAVRFEVEGPYEATRARARLLHPVRSGLGGDRRTGLPLPAPIAELHAVVEDLALAHDARLRVRAVVGAQLELVREVGVRGDRDADRGGRRTVAGDAQRLHERSLGDGLFAEQCVRGRFVAAAPRHQHTACRVTVRDRRERLGHRAVHRQLPAAEVPGVPDE